MKNWFAIMAAAMVAAMTAHHQRGGHAHHRSRSGTGRHSPSGAKVLRKAYKAALGMRGGYKDAVEWYRKLNNGKYKAGHQRTVTGQPVKF